MFSHTAKLLKPGGEPSNDVEQSVSQALLDLEANSDLSSALRGLYFVGAEECVIRDDKVPLFLFFKYIFCACFCYLMLNITFLKVCKAYLRILAITHSH